MPIVKATVGHPMRRAPGPGPTGLQIWLKDSGGSGVEAGGCQTLLGPLPHD